MYKIKELFLVSLLLILTGCGSSSDTSSSTSSTVDAEPIKKAVIQIDKLTVDVQKNSFDTTTKLLDDVGSMLHSVAIINESVGNRLDLSMELVNTLAQPLGIVEGYKSLFATTTDYNATSPAFEVTGTLTKNYFLLSSETPFFVEKKTVKGYFTNPATLASTWVSALSVADKSKNLYLSIVEIDGDNLTHKVSNALLIKSVDLQNL